MKEHIPEQIMSEAQSAALAATLGDGIGSTQEAVSLVLENAAAVRTILGVEAPPEQPLAEMKIYLKQNGQWTLLEGDALAPEIKAQNISIGEGARKVSYTQLTQPTRVRKCTTMW